MMFTLQHISKYNVYITDGFVLREANLWWVKVLSEFNSGKRAVAVLIKQNKIFNSYDVNWVLLVL